MWFMRAENLTPEVKANINEQVRSDLYINVKEKLAFQEIYLLTVQKMDV